MTYLTKLKNIIFIASVLVFFLALPSQAQDITTVEATSSEISDNLDLEAVASVFGESEDLEDFEKRLNDPKTQISNLDLNKDEEVDYLRVIEASKGEAHSVTIQAVLGKDKYQDVALINVEKDSSGETQVQVVGDVSMYGPSYVITPVYVHRPVIIIWFWVPHYNPWRSPYYWGHYPRHYHPWHPHPTHRYRTNVRVNVNVNNSYKRTTAKTSKTTNVSSKKESDKATKAKESTGKPVKDDWKTDAEKKIKRVM